MSCRTVQRLILRLIFEMANNGLTSAFAWQFRELLLETRESSGKSKGKSVGIPKAHLKDCLIKVKPWNFGSRGCKLDPRAKARQAMRLSQRCTQGTERA